MILLSLVLVGLFVAPIRTQNETTEVAPVAKDAEHIHCPPGTILSSIITQYKPNGTESNRAWVFGCRKISHAQQEDCYFVTLESIKGKGTNYESNGCVMPNSFMNGFSRDPLEDGIHFRYKIQCCQAYALAADGRKDFKQIAYPTCKTKVLVLAGHDKHASLIHGDGVITSVHTSYSAKLKDRSWYLTTCSFTDELLLSNDSHSRFPSNQIEPYGVKKDAYSWESKCKKPGTVVTKIESVWGHANGDRAFTVGCAEPGQPLTCVYTIERQPEDETLPPQNWTGDVGGCTGNQALVSIAGSKPKEYRRYKFGCCELDGGVDTPSVNESSCLWHKVSSEHTADWSTHLDNVAGHVYRGVRGSYLAGGDRANIELEICRLSGIKEPEVTKKPETDFSKSDSGCLYGITKPTPEAIKKASFEKYNGLTIQACTLLCIRHPFCVTFRYAEGGTCYLTYESAKANGVCKATENLSKMEKDADVWIQCYRCAGH